MKMSDCNESSIRFRGWRWIQVCDLMNSRKRDNKSELGGGCIMRKLLKLSLRSVLSQWNKWQYAEKWCLLQCTGKVRFSLSKPVTYVNRLKNSKKNLPLLRLGTSLQ
ncbi:hypothetical protein Gotri_014629 [Gossypium trilobum]|uniref:Uncharacterized protein n=1 Tax=Gossypium trilobum TaxID=34281 RepID=A0A7J9DXG3_9ROSI|nr:hypothetical protein [Gossypium trilobum]